uniref:Major facilitator superfamily (MFS) profile domain-containing protein n=1 Tax=Fusarium oxysporum (strain Fo5176) TaxID=660025 RepID=A0A0D2XRQ8_FUSOF
MTIASSEFAKSYVGTDGDGKAVYSNATVSKAALSMVFIFGAIFSFDIMPLQTLHPVEVLSFEMRAKGMAFSNLAVNAVGLLNQFSWPVARKEIGWKTYRKLIVEKIGICTACTTYCSRLPSPNPATDALMPLLFRLAAVPP